MITNVLEYLERSALRFPDKICFGDTEKQLTYRELFNQAKRAGSRLAAYHLKNQPIAVITNHSVDCLAAFLGVAYSGNFYVPLDEKQPEARMEAILKAADPKVVLVPDNFQVPFGLNNRIVLYRKELFAAKADEDNLARIRENHLDVDPLYLMFTSGSTGVPKGVLVSHRSVIDLAEQFARTFSFDENEIFANQAPFDFDVSVKDIYSALRNGASMYIVPQSMFSMPKKLIPYLNEKKVTTCIWAVSALSVLTVMKLLDKEVPQYIKKILFSGEVMPVKVLNYWRQHLPEVMYVNLYGPTEITCNCTYYILDREFELQETVPIGKPFANTQILLLDGSGKEVAFGETGEICVRGSCLALGYYNNQEATEAAFRQNPSNRSFPDKIYHTGDYGRYDKNGLLYFAARKDWQIKHMGHRIELSEIESAVNSLKAVESCCCQYDQAKGKIVLVYQAKEACDSDIIEELKKLLPKYMCPNRLVWLPQIPRNQRGKIDRVFLKRKYAKESKNEEKDYLYKEAVVLGTGSLALWCTEALEKRKIPCRLYDTGVQQSKTLERQCAEKNLNYQWLPKGDLTARLTGIGTPTLLVSAINPWIIPGEVLENPYLESINCHQALLPAHPGRNAEMWAIYEEDEKTGVTWHVIRPQVDRGEILIQKEFFISPRATSFSVFRQQCKLAYEAFLELLEELLMGTVKGRAQTGEPCRLRYSWETPEDGRLDTSWEFHKLSAFLRALDYGGLAVTQKPYLEAQGRKLFWKSYQIQTEPQDREDVFVKEDQICIMRKEGKITLKHVYEGGF